MDPGDRHSVLIETGGQPVEPIRAVHVMLNVFFPGPHDLHRAVDMLCALHGPRGTIGFQPPSKSAAEEMIVDYDLAYWQSGGACRRSLSARDSLGTDPHLTAVLADVDRAVHRLQRGVRKERELV